MTKLQSNYNQITEMQNSLLSFKDDDILAVTVFVNLGTSDNQEGKTRFKSVIQTAQKSRYDISKDISIPILDDSSKYFDDPSYDSMAESFIYYGYLDSSKQTLVDSYGIFTRIPVNSYVSISDYFDLSILDMHLNEIQPRLIVDMHLDHAVLYEFTNYQLLEIENKKSSYVELVSKDLNSNSIPGAGQRGQPTLVSVHSGGQRTDPEIDLARKFVEDIIERITELDSKANYTDVFVYYQGTYFDVIETSFSPLSTKVNQYEFIPNGINIETDPNEYILDITKLIRAKYQHKLSHMIISATEQGLCIKDVSEIVDAVNHAKVSTLFVPNVQYGPGYIDGDLRISHTPQKGYSQVDNLKDHLAKKTAEYGGEILTTPSDRKDMIAIIRWL